MTTLAMDVRLAHVAPDGARTYHDAEHRIAAVLGAGEAVLARWRGGYRDFDIYSAPAQPEGIFLLVRFDLDADELARSLEDMRLPNGERWVRLTADELAEFVVGEGPPDEGIGR